MFVFELPTPSAAILGDPRRFPVRRIYCVGRNYAAHTREMGGDPEKQPPFFFMKPPDAVVTQGDVAYPQDTDNLHYEVELVVAIGHGGKDIPTKDSWAHIFGYGVGVDLTRRDRQAEATAARQPWEKSKGFDQSAPLSVLTPSADMPHMTSAAISLSVNGAVKQNSNISDLIWNVPEIISILSRSWALERGDLIYTGTPDGIGPLKRGDEVLARVEGLQDLRFRIV